MKRNSIAWLLGVLLAGVPAWADGIVETTVSGNEVSASLELPGGIEAVLTIAFESVSGLSEESLGLSAELIDPLDPDLLSRLPAGGLVSVLAAFPVLIRIAPPPGSELAFHGPARVKVDTPNLPWVPGSPFRLFAGPLGGPFEDATAGTGSGSFRAGGDEPEFFFDFILLSDLRSDEAVIAAKFDRLETALESHAPSIDPAVLAQLETLLEEARTADQAGAPLTAVQEIEAFADLVREQSGAPIPDLWQASGELVNVAGSLRSKAATLRFSLLRKASENP